jgi:hypothetical protein
MAERDACWRRRVLSCSLAEAGILWVGAKRIFPLKQGGKKKHRLTAFSSP